MQKERTMHRSVVRLYLTLIAGLALLGAAAGGAAAQGAAVAPHPSHIHAGTCAELDPQPTHALNDVASVAPDAPAGAVETATTTVDATLDALLASPFAINVHESAENVANYIACGDIAGPVVNGVLLIALHQQNDSGYSGIAVLATNAAGTTDVTVYLAPAAGGATPAADAAAPSEVAVEIKDFAFTPQVLEIPVGTTVTWTNSDTTQHTATSSGVFDSGVLAQGATFSFTFDTPGTFDYICSLHPNMTGQIVVTGA
jgi:plastocyanin